MNQEQVGVLIKWLGEENFKLEAKEFDQLIKRLNKRKVDIKGNETRKQLRNMKSETQSLIKTLEVMKSNFNDMHAKGLVGDDYANEMNSKLDGVLRVVRERKKAIESQMHYAPDIDFSKIRRKWSSRLGGFAVGLETLGNGISQLSNNPINQVFTGMFRQLGVGLSNTMYEGFSQSVNRFDTFRTFPRIMSQMFGTDDKSRKAAEKGAAKQIQYLNDNVVGLPTGLDEITRSAQTYISILGNMGKGSKLAVAANNAFLASFSDDNQKYLGERQLKRLASGIKLTSTQWQSLYNSMPNAMSEVAKKMGFKTGAEFLSALKENKISNKDFLNALVESGTEGSLYNMAQEMTDTMSASIDNIKNAFARLGQGLFETVDVALKTTTGKGLPATIKGISEQIDYFAKKAQGWVKANPQIIKKWVDTLKSIDVEEFLKGFAQGILSGINALVLAAKFFAKNEKNIGRLLGGSGIWGRIITFTGQMLKGTKGIFSVIPTLIEISLLRKLSAGGAGGGKMFTGIAGLFKGLGKTSDAMGEASKKVSSSKVLSLGKGLGKFSRGLLKVSVYIEEVIVAIGVIATTIAGFVALDTFLIKKASQYALDITTNIRGVLRGLKNIQIESRGFNWDGSFVPKIRNALIDLHNISLKESGIGRYGKGDVKFAESVKGLATNYAKVVSALAGVSKKLAGMGTINVEDFNKLKQLADEMMTFYDIFNDSSFRGTSGLRQSENINELISNFSSSISSISGIAKTMSDMKKNVKAVSGNESLNKSIIRLLVDLEGIFMNLDEHFGGEYAGTRKTNKDKIQDFSDMLSSLGVAFESISSIAGVMESIKEKKTKGATKKIKSLLSCVKSIYDAFVQQFPTGEEGLTSGDIKLFATKTENLKLAIESLSNIASQFVNANETFGKISLGKGGIGSKFTSLIGDLKVISEKLIELPEVDDSSVATVDNISQSVGKVSKILNDLSKLAKKIDEVKLGGKDGIDVKIGNLFSKLSSALGIGEGDAANAASVQVALGMLSQLGGALSNISTSLNNVNENGAVVLIESLGTLTSKLDGIIKKLDSLDSKFKGKGSKWAREVINGFKSQNIESAITSALETALSTRDFSQSGYDTGASYVNGLVRGLNSVSIPDVTSSFGGSIVQAAKEGAKNKNKKKTKNEAKGGLIYASRGQWINFQPKGTDTVPAMLTPGEFVQRRGAVNHFGVRFMEKINNLDLPGALNSLSMRARGLTMPMGSPTIVNNTTNNRNNNASVTQHIHTNKERVSFKHADRYVRAL